jgi:hypothetical protein
LRGLMSRWIVGLARVEVIERLEQEVGPLQHHVAKRRAAPCELLRQVRPLHERHHQVRRITFGPVVRDLRQ